jgi:hypothetical protein
MNQRFDPFGDQLDLVLEEKVEELQTICIARATGEHTEEDQQRYKQLRKDIVHNEKVKRRVPSFVKTSRSLGSFWAYIKGKFDHYDERRQHIREEFRPLLDYVEFGEEVGDEAVEANLDRLDSEHVNQEWEKAKDRRREDPDGAITTAKSLLESVMKHILEEEGFELSGKEKMPELYHKTSNLLELHPSNHTQEPFEKMLGACHTIVDTMANLRNLFSDSHGKGKNPVKPKPRHAEFVVNLAGNLAAYIVRTWEEKR